MIFCMVIICRSFNKCVCKTCFLFILITLSENEERLLMDRLKISAEWGYPIDTLSLRMIVKEFLDSREKKIVRFKDNLPGKEFIYSFLKHHK